MRARAPAGVLTETTAELAAALTLSAARRVVEADTFMRHGQYKGWLPTLFVGQLLQVWRRHGLGVGGGSCCRCGGMAWRASGCGMARARRVSEAPAAIDSMPLPPPAHLPPPQPLCPPLPSQNKTVGIVGAGRIGAAYARMMVEGHKMNLVRACGGWPCGAAHAARCC